MPGQAIFFEKRTGSKLVRVLKVYDSAYARSCFDEMDEDALEFLSRSMDLPNKFESVGPDEDLVWEDVEENAREDGNHMSFFIVLEETAERLAPLYVSSDWPSAEAFAKTRL